MMRCEYAVWNVIPVVRREIARIMINKYKLKQKDVAEILGVRKSAVSMYLNGKRGKKIRFSEEIIKELEKIAEKAVRRGYVSKSDYCRICRKVFGDESVS